jgi:hypothetical protein
LSGVDDFISSHASGHGPLIVLLLAFILGLRHASDPDHLVAVSTLAADTRGRAARAAASLGAAWGVGHATTLLAFGLPVLLFRSVLPHAVEQSAEALIGLIIVVLAVRLLVGWRRSASRTHAHPIRTSRQAFGIGLDRSALVILVIGCAISMALLSAGFGRAFGAFGWWYLVAALQAM